MDFYEMIEFLGAALFEWALNHGFRILLILIGALVAIRLARVVGNRIVTAASDQDETTTTEREKRAATLSHMLNTVAIVVVWGIAALMLAREFGMDIGPILAGAGILGLAIGFGAQSLVKDFFSGFFLLVEDQVRIGDVIAAGGKSGLVEKLSLRTTTLRGLDGTLHVVPNGEIQTVSNHTYGWSRALIDIGISYYEDIDRVYGIIRNVAAEMRRDEQFSGWILDDIEILGVDEFGDSAILIKAMIRTQPIRQWAVARDFRRRLKIAFDKEDIEIPFPHRTIYHRVEEPLSVLALQEAGNGQWKKRRWSSDSAKLQAR